MKVDRVSRLGVVGIVLMSTILLSYSIFAEVVISGTGASFRFPVYPKWAIKYKRATGVKVTYQSIGSGGGIAQIKAKTVDFGGSDAPLEAPELEASGLIQFPMVMGGMVPTVNIKGVKPGEIRLSSSVQHYSLLLN